MFIWNLVTKTSETGHHVHENKSEVQNYSIIYTLPEQINIQVK